MVIHKRKRPYGLSRGLKTDPRCMQDNATHDGKTVYKTMKFTLARYVAGGYNKTIEQT